MGLGFRVYRGLGFRAIQVIAEAQARARKRPGTKAHPGKSWGQGRSERFVGTVYGSGVGLPGVRALGFRVGGCRACGLVFRV